MTKHKPGPLSTAKGQMRVTCSKDEIHCWDTKWLMVNGSLLMPSILISPSLHIYSQSVILPLTFGMHRDIVRKNG